MGEWLCGWGMFGCWRLGKAGMGEEVMEGGGGGWDATNGIYGRLKALLSDRRSHWRYWSENDAHAQCKRMVPSVATAGCCC